jgi:hypothetical protein
VYFFNSQISFSGRDKQLIIDTVDTESVGTAASLHIANSLVLYFKQIFVLVGPIAQSV